VFRGDARADLVGVRPRRGAVEDGLRGRRRRLRARRLCRTVVADLLARFAVPSVAPIDSLAFCRAVLSCATGAIQLRLLTANGAGHAELERFRPGLLDLVLLLFLDVLGLHRESKGVVGGAIDFCGGALNSLRRGLVLKARSPDFTSDDLAKLLT